MACEDYYIVAVSDILSVFIIIYNPSECANECFERQNPAPIPPLRTIDWIEPEFAPVQSAIMSFVTVKLTRGESHAKSQIHW